MFETIKHKSKRNYYSQKMLEYRNSAKKACNIIKEVIGKTNKSGSCLLSKLVINKIDVTSQNDIANEFTKQMQISLSNL